MQFVLEFPLFEFEFALQGLDQLRRVLAQHLAHRQLDRAVVLDDDDAAGDGDFAVRESVERVHQLLGVHAGRTFDFDLDVF